MFTVFFYFRINMEDKIKISGFGFVRNAFEFGYPFEESLFSLEPLCDEIVIAAGKSDDNTVEYLQSLKLPKLKIIVTDWNDSPKLGGEIYSQQTNIALSHCTGSWCIYLQADEVLHENDKPLILDGIQRVDDNPDIDGLLFKYKHFYGSYDYIGVGRQWYRREIRAFRNTGNVVSWGDAQGFRIKNDSGFRKLKARQTNASIYHYGWVRQPRIQHMKMVITSGYYREHPDDSVENAGTAEFDYGTAYDLEIFKGEHPAVMKKKIETDKSWTKNFDPYKLSRKPFLMKILDMIEKLTGHRIGEYRDFVEVK